MAVSLYVMDKEKSTETRQVWFPMYQVNRPRVEDGKIKMEVYKHLVQSRVKELEKLLGYEPKTRSGSGPQELVYILERGYWRRQGKLKKSPSKIKSHPKKDKRKADYQAKLRSRMDKRKSL